MDDDVGFITPKSSAVENEMDSYSILAVGVVSCCCLNIIALCFNKVSIHSRYSVVQLLKSYERKRWPENLDQLRRRPTRN
jgi:hypothetical protein